MKKEKNIFDVIFDRLLVLGVSSQKELADILGVTRAAVSGARQRGVFPKRWAVILGKVFKRNAGWILGLEVSTEEQITEEGNILLKRMIALEEKNEERLVRMESAYLFLHRRLTDLQEGQVSQKEAARTGKNYSDQSWKEEERLLEINA